MYKEEIQTQMQGTWKTFIEGPKGEGKQNSLWYI